MDLVGGVAARMGFSAERVDDLKTAVAEATINAIEHGNRLDASLEVCIVLVPAADSLAVAVRDQSGAPFTPTSGGMPDVAAKVESGVDTRGWGTFLIQSLVDEVEYTATSEGNCVRMVVHLDR
jgi:serine/threonine-protein kinase RsbW